MGCAFRTPPGTPSRGVQCLLCFLKPATTHTLPHGCCNADSARPWYLKLDFILNVKDYFSSATDEEKYNHFQDGPLEGGIWGHRHQAYPGTRNPDPMIHLGLASSVRKPGGSAWLEKVDTKVALIRNQSLSPKKTRQFEGRGWKVVGILKE